MTISVDCGGCGKTYQVGEDKAGKKFKCKKCGDVVSIPQDEEEFADAFELLDKDEAEDDRPRRSDTAGRRRSKPQQKSGRKRGTGRDAARDTDSAKPKSSINIGRLIGRIVLFGTLAVALIVAGLDYRQKQQAITTTNAITNAIDTPGSRRVPEDKFDSLITGNPKREEEGGRLKMTYGIVRDYVIEVTLGRSGGQVNLINVVGPANAE